MQYELPEVYKGSFLLQFSDPSFEGLEVRMGRHSFAAVDAAVKLRDIDLAKAGRGELDMNDWGNLQGALAEFSDALLEWNLTLNGEKVPTDFATVRRLDLVFVLQIFLVWVQAIIGLEWETFEEGTEAADITVNDNTEGLPE